ncbi:serpin family protein [Oceanirhabdus seepicola]|uniref:Serpin domain-containing protein n=1 Tax=Oceanirhabdus seepicola TaxID=2828781 RepID=A0A9J6P1U1_9CLOT|nr:serpin family protein [Oceanirhabdus seepicola]MCM1989853.1 hypothetical protein [Oceanirhabdus seepicola]
MKKWVGIFLFICMMMSLSGCNTTKNETRQDIDVEIIEISVRDRDDKIGEIAEASKVINRSAFHMMNQLNNQENMLISSLSIASSLALLQNGGSNGSDEEIITYLFGEDININEAKEIINNQFKELIIDCANGEEDEVIIGNSMWFDSKVSESIYEDFLNVSKENFFSEVYSEDFINDTEKSVSKVNKWIELKSKGKLKDIMNEDEVTEEFFGTLVNTLYFKGNWSTEFSPSNTKKEKFTKVNGDTIMVDMMNRNTLRSVYEDDKMYALDLPYQGPHVMTFILPKEGITLNEVLKDVSLEFWNGKNDEDKRVYSEVRMKIPKFRYEYETELNKYLNDNGINKIFSIGEKPLEGIMKNAYISQIKHNTIISLDEEGTEAAAVTREHACGSAMPKKEVDFYCDRPFAFIISNRMNDTILFSGVVYEPKF